MEWPVRWLLDVEAAKNVYTTLVEVNRAMTRLHGDDLLAWQREHAAMVRYATVIEQLLLEDTDGQDD